MPLLNVENLKVEFRTEGRPVQAVRGITFSIEPGETVGMVGESGSGKSAAALALMRLLPAGTGFLSGGSVKLAGKDLSTLTDREICRVRGADMAMVFQDPFSCLNPTMTIAAQIMEPLRLHRGMTKREARTEALRLLQAVRIPSAKLRMNSYPHQLSGGQRQRVMIAIAFACSPGLLIADEPTTALDVTVQAQILTLMADLQKRIGAGVLLITHDLGVVAEACDRVLVMYAGEIVECGTAADIFYTPLHPYTKGLLASLPPQEGPVLKRFPALEGGPPDLSDLPAGCPFYDRCSSRLEGVCNTAAPPLISSSPDRSVRCLLYTLKEGEIALTAS